MTPLEQLAATPRVRLPGANVTIALFDKFGWFEQAVEFLDGLATLIVDPRHLEEPERLQAHLQGEREPMSYYLRGERTFPEVAEDVRLLNGGIGALMVFGGILFHPPLQPSTPA